MWIECLFLKNNFDFAPDSYFEAWASEKDLVLKWHRFDFQTTSYERIDHEP